MLLALAYLQLQRPTDFTVDGVRRQALIIEGTGASPRTGRPVVLAFHGHGGNMRSASLSFHVQDLWREATVVYPQGLPTVSSRDPEGAKNGWQVRPGGMNDRDVKFVDVILASLKGVDRTKVFAMGHSNGGAMVYVLWASRPQVFAAYGPSGSPATTLPRFLTPAPMFATMGQKDQIVSPEAQWRSIQALAKRDQVDLDHASHNGYITLATGATGIPFGDYVHPGGHEYPAEAAQATVEFFKRIAKR